ncbi:MAG: leucyl aminopeptidase [Acidobacteriaceae bacterium]
MKTDLRFENPAEADAELLVAFAVNKADKKDPKAEPKVALLSEDAALVKATAAHFGGQEFAAGSCETLLLHAPAGLKAQRLLIVGVEKANANELRKAAGAAVRFAKPRKIRSLTLVLSADLPAAEAARAAVEGAYVGDFDPDTYRSDRKDRSIESLSILAPKNGDKSATEAGFREGVILGEAQNFARSLVNEPGNVLTPTELGKRAAAMAKANGLKCEVHSTDKLKELKMGAFWSVSQGSAEPPALIVMRYEPEGAAADGPVLGLVGKGITFDTGGISIKPADNMEKMKYDMAGGAAMIGAMQAIAQLKPKVRVISVVCAAENMPSGTAYKPGDISTAMSGKTIEIINTDAEGRLVLADGLHYARQLGATHLIDAATLTGACVVALGMVNGGVFSNDDETYGHFVDALKTSGERFWRLPVEDEYREQIKSSIGDIMNTGGRYGGAVTAAMFLKEFVDETPWIHLDIAGIAWMEEQKPWIAKGPSGVAVRSIAEWVRTYER